MSLTSASAAKVVRAASLLRGERIIHPRGVTLRGRLHVLANHTGAALFDQPGTHDVLLRLSRAAGLPPPLPDTLGMAIRVLDAYGPGAHQDLLLDAGAGSPFLRRLPLPRWQVLRSTYSSLLPYDVGGERRLLGALPVAGAPAVTRLDDLLPADVRFRLCVATAHGPWRDVGSLEATEVHPAGRQVRFSPFNTGNGLRPAGWLQELRKASYDAAHVGADA